MSEPNCSTAAMGAVTAPVASVNAVSTGASIKNCLTLRTLRCWGSSMTRPDASFFTTSGTPATKVSLSFASCDISPIAWVVFCFSYSCLVALKALNKSVAGAAGLLGSAFCSFWYSCLVMLIASNRLPKLVPPLDSVAAIAGCTPIRSKNA